MTNRKNYGKKRLARIHDNHCDHEKKITSICALLYFNNENFQIVQKKEESSTFMI